MLRLLVLVLVLANGAYFAWSQGFLRTVGFAPAQQSEPQRMGQQIKPQSLHILSADEARRQDTASAAPAPKPPECLQAGLFDAKQSDTLRQSLAAWPTATWSLDSASEPAHWIVYMGKYAAPDLMARKKAELRQLGVNWEALNNASLEPGLSLGGFDSQAAANQQLTQLSGKGVRTARVVQEKIARSGQMLKLPAVDDTLRPKLDDIKTALAGNALRPCK